MTRQNIPVICAVIMYISAAVSVYLWASGSEDGAFLLGLAVIGFGAGNLWLNIND